MTTKNTSPIRTCNICHEPKPLSEFYPHLGTRRCKKCINHKNTEYQRKRRIKLNNSRHGFPSYKIVTEANWKNQGIVFNGKKFTLEIYNLLLQIQNHRCYLCEGTDIMIRFSVDHNHETGEVRGLLCHGCNMAVGIFEKKGHYRSAWHENKIKEYLENPPIRHLIGEKILVEENGNA